MNSQNNPPYSLTTPLYYVNDIPHIGSAYTTIAVDVLARFQRLRGYDVLFVTGTDEHGQKIQRTAAENGLDPQVHCDRIVAKFQELWQKLDIQFDRFIRTTDDRHSIIVKEFFQRVWDKGDIYTDRQQGWYCVACEEFKEEKDLIEGDFCATHTNKKVEWRDEENYFFKLSKYQQELELLYAKNPDFIQPESRRNEILNFVESGLRDFSISRLNVEWGFPVPVDPNQTIYVWFDALLGYISALLESDAEISLENAIAKWYPFNLHLIGKDILRFHAIYWPAMLISAGLPLPEKVFGHGFLTKDGKKMGKTLGNTLDPFALIDKYGADAVRYYFLKEIEFGKDGDFSEIRFINTLNADLANDLGNLLNRSLGMLLKYCQGRSLSLLGKDLATGNPLQEIGRELGDRVTKAYESLQFNLAVEEIFSLIRNCNKYIDESAPWALFKQEKQTQVEQVLYSVLESVRLSAYLLAPIIPSLSTKIYQQLGFDFNFNDKKSVNNSETFQHHSHWGELKANKLENKPVPVFSRLELPTPESTSKP
jgi:methionyl-tRNA synthetase